MRWSISKASGLRLSKLSKPILDTKIGDIGDIGPPLSTILESGNNKGPRSPPGITPGRTSPPYDGAISEWEGEFMEDVKEPALEEVRT